MELPITNQQQSPQRESATTRQRRRRTVQLSPIQIALLVCLFLSVMNQFDVNIGDFLEYFRLDAYSSSSVSLIRSNSNRSRGAAVDFNSFSFGSIDNDVTDDYYYTTDDNVNETITDDFGNATDAIDLDSAIDGDVQGSTDTKGGEKSPAEGEIKTDEKGSPAEDTEKDDGVTFEEGEIKKDNEETPGAEEGIKNDEEESPAEDTKKADEDNVTSDSSCTFENSETWLNGPRISNIDEEEMTDEYIQNLIIHNSPMDADSFGAKEVLGQSICLKDSGFLNWDKGPTMVSKTVDPLDDREVQEIVARLVFLAIHEHQWSPAREEALARYGKKEGCKGKDDAATYNKALSDAGVGRLDFECPNTKFFVTLAGNLGFGASVRVGMGDPLFYGLSTNRTTLFLNSLDFMEERFHGDWETRLVKDKWKLSSCPRRDMQCMYMPFSPCSLTHEDMKNARFLPKQEIKHLRFTGELREEYQNDKVLILIPDLDSPKPEPIGTRPKLVSIIQSFYANRVDEMKEAWQLDDEMLQKVYDYILMKDKKTVMMDYIVRQVATMYVLRPNLRARKQLDKEMERIIPQNFDPMTAVGFPIRGSDKCKKESECRTFDNYMDMIKDWIKTRTETLRSQNDESIIDKIILTSEDKGIMEGRFTYSKNESFPYEFIVNDEDIGQGTGLPKEFKEGTGDEIMLASLVSLQMQLHSESLLLNHCSNFHKLIMDLALHNCGVSKYMELLKENDNPEYRLKCAWTKL